MTLSDPLPDSLLDTLLADLDTEGDRLLGVVRGLDADGWATPTPAEGWTVATQVGHLAWTDTQAVLAARAVPEVGGADGKAAWDALVTTAMGDTDGFVDAGARELGGLALAEGGPDALLARWGDGRDTLAETLRALESVPGRPKMPWFGPPMSAVSMATARFMETWAHSLDVHEGLGLPAEPTDRVRHVAELGVRTRGFSFLTHGLEVPDAPVRVELTAPSGATWTWGPDDAPERVEGSAQGFALLVTQRVHRDDTDLVATGAGATRWLELAQAFAGPPGAGRQAVGARG